MKLKDMKRVKRGISLALMFVLCYNSSFMTYGMETKDNIYTNQEENQSEIEENSSEIESDTNTVTFDNQEGEGLEYNKDDIISALSTADNSLKWSNWNPASNYGITKVDDQHLKVPIMGSKLNLAGTYQIVYGSGEVGKIVVTYSPGWTIPTTSTNQLNVNVASKMQISGSASIGYTVTYTALSSGGNGGLSFGANMDYASIYAYPGADLTIDVKIYNTNGDEITDMGGTLFARVDEDLFPDSSEGGRTLQIARDNYKGQPKIHTNKSEYLTDESCSNSASVYFYHKTTNDLFYSTDSGYFDGVMNFSEDARLVIDLTKIQVSTSNTYSTGLRFITAEELDALTWSWDNRTGYEYNAQNHTLIISAGSAKHTSSGSLGPFHYVTLSVPTAINEAQNVFPGTTYLWFNAPDMYSVVNGDGNVTNTLYMNDVQDQNSAKVTFNPTPYQTAASVVIQPYIQNLGDLTIAPNYRAGGFIGNNWVLGRPDSIQSLFSLYLESGHTVYDDTISFQVEIPNDIKITHVFIPEVSTTSKGALYGGNFEILDSEGNIVASAAMGTAQSVELITPVEEKFTVRMDYVGDAGNITYFNGNYHDRITWSANADSTYYMPIDRSVSFYGTVGDNWADGDKADVIIKKETFSVGSNSSLPIASNLKGGTKKFKLLRYPSQYIMPGNGQYFTNNAITNLPTSKEIREGDMFSVGETFYIRTCAANNLAGMSLYPYPYVYSAADAELEEPVIYISLPPEFVSERSDQEFTIADVYSPLASGLEGSVESVRTVKDAEGNVLLGANGGCVVEIKFKSVTPIKSFIDNGGSIVNTYWNNLTLESVPTSKTSSPATGFAYLRIMIKPDSAMLPDTQNQIIPSKTASILTASASQNRSSALYGTNGVPSSAKTVLSGTDTSITVEQLAEDYGIAPFHPVSDTSDYYLLGAPLSSILGTWPQSGFMKVYVDDKGGNKTTYNPKSEDGSKAAMKSATSGEYIIEITNLNTTKAENVVGYFKIPETADGRWQTAVGAAITLDSTSTYSGTVKIFYAAPGTTPDYDNTSDWVLPYEGTPYAVKIELPEVKGGQKYVGRLPFNLPGVDGTIVVNGDEVIGMTKYSFGVVNEVLISSTNGDAYTGAIKVKISAPPEITIPGLPNEVTTIEYKTDAVPNWEGITVTDDVTNDVTLASVAVMFTPAPEIGGEPRIVTQITNQNRGVYSITYVTAPDADGQTATATRKIIVKDTTPDALELLQAVPYEIERGSNPPADYDTWSDYFISNQFIQVKVQDPYDVTIYANLRVISSNVNVNKTGVYSVTVEYTDISGNVSNIIFEVRVGIRGTIGMMPEITAMNKIIQQGTSYSWSDDVTAFDPEDGELTPYVIKIVDSDGIVTTYSKAGQPSGLDTSILKEYSVTYEVADSDNNTVTTTRTILIQGKVLVSFDVNGGNSAAPASQEVIFADTYGHLPGENGDSTPIRTGYNFEGWYTAASGGTQVTGATRVTNASNHTLYAHWKAKGTGTGSGSGTGTSTGTGPGTGTGTDPNKETVSNIDLGSNDVPKAGINLDVTSNPGNGLNTVPKTGDMQASRLSYAAFMLISLTILVIFKRKKENL